MRKLEAGGPWLLADSRWMHEYWLGSLYSGAGVFQSKAAAELMGAYDSQELRAASSGPKRDMKVTAELIAASLYRIHKIQPFEVGNGRLSRWIADLIALRHGFPVINWHGIAKRKEDYELALSTAEPEGLRNLTDQVYTALTSSS